MNPVAARSYERLTKADLRHIRDLALARLDEAFARAPVARLYRNRLLLLALCQGAAQHYVDGRHGVKDIDVWAFFRAGPAQPFPARANWHADFGPSRLGRHPDFAGYVGRKLDVLGRSIECRRGQALDDAVRMWLQGRSASARLIAMRPVIGLAPEPFFGRVIWSPS